MDVHESCKKEIDRLRLERTQYRDENHRLRERNRVLLYQLQQARLYHDLVPA